MAMYAQPGSLVHHRRTSTLLGLIACLISLAISFPSHAGEVQVNVSQRETEVGVPITLSIEIINAKSHDRPTIPPIENATVELLPGVSESSTTSIINGQVTTRSSRFIRYRIIPQAAGRLTIPAFDVVVDGETFATKSIEIIVAKPDFNADTDVLFVELTAGKESLYIGQPLQLNLRLWIRPYQNSQFNVRINQDQMLGLIDWNASSWGGLSDAVAKLRDPFGSVRMNRQEELREDSTGQLRAYYLYELPITIWPQQIGPFTMEPVRLVLNYPTRLREQGGFFGGLEIADYRRMTAVATLPDVYIKAPPSEGQPATFNGAIGMFDLHVTASPTEVAVGDPITLTLTLQDRSQGGTQMDLLQPPALDRVPELTQNFRMPTEALAGAVSGRTKTFTQTIRAKRDDITQIPAIPFTYFDPTSETYITRTSEAIPIRVKAGSQLNLSELGVPAAQQAPAASNLKQVTTGLLANYGDPTTLLATQAFQFDKAALVIIAAPPALFALASIGLLAARKRQKHSPAARRRAAGRHALQQLRRASSLTGSDQAKAVLSAFADYVRAKYDLGTQSLTSEEIVRHLNADAEPKLLDEVSRMLRECESAMYTGDVAFADNTLTTKARECIEQLERQTR